jgi:hypothetical protein
MLKIPKVLSGIVSPSSQRQLRQSSFVVLPGSYQTENKIDEVRTCRYYPGNGMDLIK